MSQLTAIRAYFDALADEYSQERERQHSFCAQREAVLELLDCTSGRIADVGCGPAVLAPDLLERGFEVWGVDASEQMIARGTTRLADHPLRGRLHLSVGDIEALRFPRAYFDAVVAMGVLEYLPDYHPALAEMHRILRPGGILVLTVPNRRSAYHLARALRPSHAAARRDGFAVNRCVPSHLDRELAACGFLKLESRSCNYMFYPLHDLHPALSLGLNKRLSSLRGLPQWLGTQYILKAQKRR